MARMNTRYPVQKWIKNWMTDNDVQQKELARRCGIDDTLLSRIINGHRPIELDLAAKLAEIMGVPMQDIAARSREEPLPVLSSKKKMTDQQDDVMSDFEASLAAARQHLRERGYEIVCEIRKMI